MTVVLDTSFLFALTDLTDRNHDRVLAVSHPPPVMPLHVLGLF